MPQKELLNTNVAAIGDSTVSARSLASGTTHQSSMKNSSLTVILVSEEASGRSKSGACRNVRVQLTSPRIGATVSLEIRTRGSAFPFPSEKALQDAALKACHLGWETVSRIGQKPKKAPLRAAKATEKAKEDVPVAEPKLKRRGRPPKAIPESPEANPVPVVAKRPVGRPRIHPKTDPDVPKRPVGRPRKKPLE